MQSWLAINYFFLKRALDCMFVKEEKILLTERNIVDHDDL